MTRYAAEILSSVHPVLAYAFEMAGTLGADGESDARRALDAAAQYIGLYAPLEYVQFRPDELLHDKAAMLLRPGVSVHVEPVAECVGRPAAVAACMAIIVDNAELDSGTGLEIEVFEEDKMPLVTCSFVGPGRFSERFTVDGFFGLTMQELSGRWTDSTRGGRIDKGPHGLIARLKGARMPSEPVRGLDAIERAIAVALAARGSAFREAVAQALLVAEEGWASQAPADLRALMNDVTGERKRDLDAQGIALELWTAPETPPISLSRSAMAAFLAEASQLAIRVLPSGGTMGITVAYSAEERRAVLTLRLDGPRVELKIPYQESGMRRIVESLHGGALECVRDGRPLVLTATVPDCIGAALDTWIPGWSVYSARSQQMLRLLKAQPGALPEAAVLGGVLEEELERWLLPALDTPVAGNVARELEHDNAVQALKSDDSLKKALGQIKKGKPRKEVAQPKYAAEILWVYRRDERSRKAIRAERLSQDEIEMLCKRLVENPVPHVECLRIIARAIV